MKKVIVCIFDSYLDLLRIKSIFHLEANQNQFVNTDISSTIYLIHSSKLHTSEVLNVVGMRPQNDVGEWQIIYCANDLLDAFVADYGGALFSLKNTEKLHDIVKAWDWPFARSLRCLNALNLDSKLMVLRSSIGGEHFLELADLLCYSDLSQVCDLYIYAQELYQKMGLLDEMDLDLESEAWRLIGDQLKVDLVRYYKSILKEYPYLLIEDSLFHIAWVRNLKLVQNQWICEQHLPYMTAVRYKDKQRFVEEISTCIRKAISEDRSERNFQNIPNGFTPLAYLCLNADLLSAGVNPYEHYSEFGYGEGREYILPETSGLIPKVLFDAQKRILSLVIRGYKKLIK